MYKVTIKQEVLGDITLKYESISEAFELIDRVLLGSTKNITKCTIEFTEGDE